MGVCERVTLLQGESEHLADVRVVSQERNKTAQPHAPSCEKRREWWGE